MLATGLVDRIGRGGALRLRGANGADLPLPDGLTARFGDHGQAMDTVLAALAELVPGRDIGAVGHRVVHGGPDHDRPVRRHARLLAALDRLSPFAPLHQPHNLAGIRAAGATFPGAVQVACFDAAFHRGHPFVNDTFARPRALYDKGMRRYGFHGLSYDCIAGALAETAPDLARAGPGDRGASCQRRVHVRAARRSVSGPRRASRKPGGLLARRRCRHRGAGRGPWPGWPSPRRRG